MKEVVNVKDSLVGSWKSDKGKREIIRIDGMC